MTTGGCGVCVEVARGEPPWDALCPVHAASAAINNGAEVHWRAAMDPGLAVIEPPDREQG
jgi:hypothetical protein